MKKILLLLFLLIANFALSQPGSKIKLDSLLEVQFPAKPTFKITDKEKVYFFNDKSAFYFTVIQDVKDITLSEDSLEAFYTGIAHGAAKGSKFNKKDVMIDGMKAIDFDFTSPQTGFPEKRFQRAVYLNKKVYTFVFWTFGDSLKTSLPKRDHFFNSVKVVGDKSTIRQYTTKGLAYNIGYYLGKTAFKLFVLLIIGLIVWGIVIIGRRAKRKRLKV